VFILDNIDQRKLFIARFIDITIAYRLDDQMIPDKALLTYIVSLRIFAAGHDWSSNNRPCNYTRNNHRAGPRSVGRVGAG
jgi:hypothetical protein